MIGKKYGQWEVLKREENSGQGQKRWLCQCSCGSERIFTTSYLNSGKPTWCSDCRKKYKEEIEKFTIEKYLNKKIGDFTVVKYLGKNKYKSREWLCKCKCGDERVFRTSMLSGNGVVKATQCQKCYRESVELDNRVRDFIPNRFWYKLLNVAKRRKKEITITKKYLYEIYEKQNKKCIFTGTDLYFTKLRTNYYRYTNSSLDRINSSKGYVESNVQWVLKDINMMKQKLTDADFIKLCKMVANNN